MEWTSRDWVGVFGKAYSGKSYFIHKHLEKLPKSRKTYVYDFAHDYADLAKKSNIMVYAVKHGTQEEIEEFIQLVYKEGNCTVVLSESDNYLQMTSPVLLAFVTTGRNRGINCILDGKRPMAVKPSYRGRFNRLVLFATQLPADLEYLEDWCGTEKGGMDVLRTLETGQFIEVDLDKQIISGVKKL